MIHFIFKKSKIESIKKWFLTQLILVISFIPTLLRLIYYRKTIKFENWRFSIIEFKKLFLSLSGTKIQYVYFFSLIISFLIIVLNHNKIKRLKKDFLNIIYLCFLLMIPILIPLIYSLLIKNIFMNRYVIFCLVPLYILIGYFIDKLPRILQYISLIIIIFFSIISIKTYSKEVNNEEWNKVANFIIPYRDEYTNIILEPGYTVHPFVFYSEFECFKRIDIYNCAAENKIFTLWNKFEQEKEYVKNSNKVIYIRRKIYGDKDTTEYFNYLLENFKISNKASYKTVYDVDLQVYVMKRKK
jgi:hypothetical protein